MKLVDYTSEYREELARLVNEFNDYIVAVDTQGLVKQFKSKTDLLAYTDKLTKDVADMNGFVYLALVEDKPVGYIQGVIPDNTQDILHSLTYEPGNQGWVGEFYVEDAYRGQGIGAALFAKAKEHFKLKHCTALRLYVLGCNNLAMDIYHSQGMVTRHHEMDLKL